MQRSLFYLPLLASLCLTFLSSFSPAHANGCDLSNPLDGVAGGSLCIAVEAITENRARCRIAWRYVERQATDLRHPVRAPFSLQRVREGQPRGSEACA